MFVNVLSLDAIIILDDKIIYWYVHKVMTVTLYEVFNEVFDATLH